MLFSAITRQEIGFFDTTLTGDVTSRLVADTTQLGDQVRIVIILSSQFAWLSSVITSLPCCWACWIRLA
jgi:ABC-type multidrug transport system fused ATPase/permease subunit